ncbi:hypothetical protein CYL20_07280 [Pseudomonas palleroniana]|uniref:Lipoprotein n=1 Tax=Pseudomonas palleroniana TaxID=191390 RepID=A0A2L1J773_9PSED|nr:hypothetical protein [Pseudomonas palleroniana]AVE04352.1 hypothetical protein CYL20_07280 [Pseudomonas palleroniana]
MKRAAVLLLATSGLLLLGGCVPVWDDGGGYGHDHYRHYDHDRRYYDQGDDNDQGRGRRYDGRRYDRYQGRDRDDRDD